MGYPVVDDLDYWPDADDPLRAEKSLLAGVILMAFQDCQIGTDNEVVRAYKWVERMNPMFVRYCGLLQLDPDDVRDAMIEQHADKFLAVEARQRHIHRRYTKEEALAERRRLYRERTTLNAA